MKLTANFCSGVVGFSAATLLFCSAEDLHYAVIAGIILLVACAARIVIYHAHKE